MGGEGPVHRLPSVVSILSRLYPEIKFYFYYFFFSFQIRRTYMKEENEKKHIGHCMSKRIYLQSRSPRQCRLPSFPEN